MHLILLGLFLIFIVCLMRSCKTSPPVVPVPEPDSQFTIIVININD
jgi:hypothetical protein